MEVVAQSRGSCLLMDNISVAFQAFENVLAGTLVLLLDLGSGNILKTVIEVSRVWTQECTDRQKTSKESSGCC